MASTYSSNLGIELIGTGDQSGTWGSTTNTNLGTLIEQAISGYVTQAVTTGMDTTITIPNGSSGVARNMYIELTGSGGASTNLIVPANKKLYFIFNNTSSGQVTVKVSGQTGISVPNGKKMILVSNGTDIVTAENYVASLSSDNLSLTGSLSVGTTSAFTGVATFTANPVLNGGTANGVLYLNGSKVATSGSALVFDGTNLGVGVTPSAWAGAGRIIQFTNGNASIGTQNSGDANFMSNAYESSAGSWTRNTNGSGALRYQLDINNNLHKWYVAAVGSGAITWGDPKMTLDASSNLTLKGNYILDDSGTGIVSAQGTGASVLTLNGRNLITFTTGGTPTGGTERMRLTSSVLSTDSSVSVGIGTASPAYKLDVNGVGRNQGRFIVGPAVDSSDRMFYVSGNTSTSGASQFGAVINPTLPNTVTSSAYGIYTGLTIASGATVTNGYGLYLEGMSAGGSTVTNKWGLYVADTNNSYIGGNLGIGTTSPVNKLQASANALAAVPAAGASGHMLAFGSTPYGIAGGALSSGDGYLQVTRWDGTATNYNLLLQPNGGNVGIGTASPTVGLTVQKDNGSGYIAAFRNTAGSPYITLQTTSGITQIQGINSAFTATNDIAMQLSGGNVGIGTASPAQKLHISAASATSAVRLTRTGTFPGDFTLQSGGYSTPSFLIYDNTAAAERLLIDGSGNLGLGVTPSAWQSSSGASWDVIDIGGAGALAFSPAGSNDLTLAANAFYDNTDSRWEYKNTGDKAARYSVTAGGTHAWYVTNSTGSANTLISFTQAMTLDASGNLAMGSSASNARIVLTQPSGDGTVKVSGNGTDYGLLRGTTQSVDLGTSSSLPVTFFTNNSERGRFTAGGYFKASNAGTYQGATDTYHEMRNSQTGSLTTWFTHTNNSNPYGIAVEFTAAAPDNNTNYFVYCADNVTARCYIYSDGDLANHDGVYGTISDERLKQDIVDASSQWDDLKSIRFRKYRMKTDVEANPDAPAMFGVVAQELAQVCPGLVDEHPNMKTVEVTDEEGNVTQTQEPDGTTTMTVKSSILLMKAAKALQEAMARIESLEAKVSALEAQ